MRNPILANTLAAALLLLSATALPAFYGTPEATVVSWLWSAIGLAFACLGLAAAGRARFARQAVPRRVRRLPNRDHRPRD